MVWTKCRYRCMGGVFKWVMVAVRFFSVVFQLYLSWRDAKSPLNSPFLMCKSGLQNFFQKNPNPPQKRAHTWVWKSPTGDGEVVSAAWNLPSALPHPAQPDGPPGAAAGGPRCLLPPPSPAPGCRGARGLAPMGALPAGTSSAACCGLVWVQLCWARCEWAGLDCFTNSNSRGCITTWRGLSWHGSAPARRPFPRLLPSSCNRRFCRCPCSTSDLLKSSLTSD